MIVHRSPVFSPEFLTINRAGDALTLNGVSFDLSSVSEGSILPQSAINSNWIASDVTRTDGELSLTIRAPHGTDASEAERFPQPFTPDEAPLGDVGEIDWTQLVTAPTASDVLDQQRAGMVASPAQIRFALRGMSLLDAVQAIADSDPYASDAWEYASEIRRNNSMIVGLGNGGFTPEQIDEIFVIAMQIVV